jgi:hypothetical protein
LRFSPRRQQETCWTAASGAYFVYKDNGGGLLKGTGHLFWRAFRRASGDGDGRECPGAAAQTQRLRFRSNENCWSGRPYLDAVEVTLGVPPLKALLDLQWGKTI